jgi:zinc/manganese transport system ATP-binding protein
VSAVNGAHMIPGPALELRDAHVDVGGRTVWSKVSMSMAQGEFVALLGANGSGKSTLLKAALGMLGLSAGSISVLGRGAGSANAQVGYLPQRRAFDGGTRLRGRDIVRLGRDGERWGVPLPAPRRSAAGRRGLL